MWVFLLRRERVAGDGEPVGRFGGKFDGGIRFEGMGVAVNGLCIGFATGKREH